MLYRTHHHSLCFPIQSIYLLPPSTTAAPLRPPFLQLPSSPPSIEADQGMECVEIALKSSLRPETVAAKATTQQAVTDDLWAVNGQSGVSGDEFFVDDLLDFSKGDIEEGFVEENGQDNKASCVSVSPKAQEQQTEEQKHFEHRGDALSVKEDFGSVPASELSVPADDLADLEWLSHFVEDSFSEYSLTFPAVKLSEESRAESETPVQTKPCFATPVQTKARSKRVRAGGRVWSLGSPSLTESSSSTSTSSSSTSSSSPSNPWLIYASSTQTAESFLGKPPAKRPKKKKPTFGTAAVAPGGGGGPQFPRRCSHCLVQKTPQWRAGPLGAKTLCNACGVRYKSGRLLPEYRPACSPTFSSDIHSNNHRKVLEMRRKKESDSGLAPPVQSF